MTNEKGTAIAIVLMVLAVVSLIGVALLTQSQLDVQLSSSLSSYDRLFGLADGAATIGFENIRKTEDVPVVEGRRYQIYPTSKDITVASGSESFKSVDSGCAEGDPEICFQSHAGLGCYAALVLPLTDGECCPGFECPSYKYESWMADGRGVREHVLGGTSSKVEISIRICRKKGSM